MLTYTGLNLIQAAYLLDDKNGKVKQNVPFVGIKGSEIFDLVEIVKYSII